jgi:hypothetical protein
MGPGPPQDAGPATTYTGYASGPDKGRALCRAGSGRSRAGSQGHREISPVSKRAEAVLGNTRTARPVA